MHSRRELHTAVCSTSGWSRASPWQSHAEEKADPENWGHPKIPELQPHSSDVPHNDPPCSLWFPSQGSPWLQRIAQIWPWRGAGIHPVLPWEYSCKRSTGSGPQHRNQAHRMHSPTGSRLQSHKIATESPQNHHKSLCGSSLLKAPGEIMKETPGITQGQY